MPSRSKQKGNRFEREVVNRAKELHIGAERAYASNGLSLGHTEEVDVVVDLDTMSKRQLEDYGREHGIELDRRHSHKKLVEELKEHLSNS